MEGKTAQVAKQKLEELGFIVVEDKESSDTYAAGVVTYVEGAGLSVEKGSTVTIVVSTGPSANEGNHGTDTGNSQ